MTLIQSLYQFDQSFSSHHHVWYVWLDIRPNEELCKWSSIPFRICLPILYSHRNIVCNVLISFCMSDMLQIICQIKTSQKWVMIVSASNTNCEIWTWWSGSIEIFGMPIVLPSSSGPEKGLVSDFVNHKKLISLSANGQLNMLNRNLNSSTRIPKHQMESRTTPHWLTNLFQIWQRKLL